LVAGLVVFAAVFSFNLDPAQGPGLAFVVLPEVFARMPGGALVGAAFFLLLTLAALTSMVSLLEVQVAFAMQRLQWSRRKASWISASLAFLLGMPASLGYGLWSAVILPDGQGILDMMDFFAVELLLPLNGLLLALLLGWRWTCCRCSGVCQSGRQAARKNLVGCTALPDTLFVGCGVGEQLQLSQPWIKRSVAGQALTAWAGSQVWLMAGDCLQPSWL